MACVLGDVDAEPVLIPALHCDERYAASVTCAGRQFLFTRREVGDDLWETLVRVGTPGNPAVRVHDFSWPLVTFSHKLKLSHNTAFMCLGNRTLVAYGGQAFLNSTSERGVMRLASRALQWPLVWGRPRLAVSGDPVVSSCVEERPIEPWDPHADRPNAGFTCEFDGKLSALQHGGRVMLFARANRFRNLGGRHVQVAMSRGATGQSFGKMAQLTFRNYTLKQTNNIYYFSVRPLWGRALLAIFPAVIEGRGGVFCAVSHDGLRWSHPLRVLASRVVFSSRTQDHPVDQDVPIGANELEFTLQHQVYLHLGLAGSCAAVPTPRFCSYRVSWPILETSSLNTSDLTAVRARRRENPKSGKWPNAPKRPQRLSSVCPLISSLRLTHASPPPSPPSPPPSPPAPEGTRVGFCDYTPPGRGDCLAGDKGSFDTGEPLKCLALCRGCARCRFVSVSRAHKDCSWFHSCHRLESSKSGGHTYVTFRLAYHYHQTAFKSR